MFKKLLEESVEWGLNHVYAQLERVSAIRWEYGEIFSYFDEMRSHYAQSDIYNLFMNWFVSQTAGADLKRMVTAEFIGTLCLFMLVIAFPSFVRLILSLFLISVQWYLAGGLLLVVTLMGYLWRWFRPRDSGCVLNSEGYATTVMIFAVLATCCVSGLFINGFLTIGMLLVSGGVLIVLTMVMSIPAMSKHGTTDVMHLVIGGVTLLLFVGALGVLMAYGPDMYSRVIHGTWFATTYSANELNPIHRALEETRLGSLLERGGISEEKFVLLGVPFPRYRVVMASPGEIGWQALTMYPTGEGVSGLFAFLVYLMVVFTTAFLLVFGGLSDRTNKTLRALGDQKYLEAASTKNWMKEASDSVRTTCLSYLLINKPIWTMTLLELLMLSSWVSGWQGFFMTVVFIMVLGFLLLLFWEKTIGDAWEKVGTNNQRGTSKIAGDFSLGGVSYNSPRPQLFTMVMAVLMTSLVVRTLWLYCQGLNCFLMGLVLGGVLIYCWVKGPQHYPNLLLLVAGFALGSNVLILISLKALYEGVESKVWFDMETVTSRGDNF